MVEKFLSNEYFVEKHFVEFFFVENTLRRRHILSNFFLSNAHFVECTFHRINILSNIDHQNKTDQFQEMVSLALLRKTNHIA